MKVFSKASKVMADADAELRKIIAEALEERSYEDVKVIVDIAASLQELKARSDVRADKEANSGGVTKYLEVATSALQIGLHGEERSAPDYPKFTMDEECLTKIGWSKKNAGEYEHRITWNTATLLVDHMVSEVQDSRIFKAEDLLPVYDQFGDDIPVYQIYLVIAWLRQAGVIKKKGRASYVISDKSMLVHRFYEARDEAQSGIS